MPTLDGERLTRELYGVSVDPRAHLARLYPDAADGIPPLDHVVMTARPLAARVTHGVWIASCPCGAPGTPAPGGVVFFSSPLVFCLRCSNQATGRGWRPVAVPDGRERDRVEAILECRPNVGDRNREPTETVDELIAQNREHGDPVPDLVAVGPPHGPTWRETVAPFGRRLALGRPRWRRLLGRG